MLLNSFISKVSKICSPRHQPAGGMVAESDLLSDEILLSSTRIRVMCAELEDALQSSSRSRSQTSSAEGSSRNESTIERQHTGAQLLLDEDPNELADADAQFSLGYRYLERGDCETALKFYKLAALKLHGSSVNNIGVLIALGKGVPADEALAIEWFKLGMELGDSRAALNYAILRTLPSNSEHMDRAEAFKIMRTLMSNLESKDVSHRSTKTVNLLRVVYNNLGCMYCRGMGVEVDAALAMDMFEQGAKLNSAVAMHNIATIYLNGFGVEENKPMAAIWFDQANATADHQDMAIIACSVDPTKLLMVTTMMLD
eukprot:TRINITY_DN34864_c0_g1_i1.p1 TRINITY_DN34864_c0_g1~~TRINITY_DN34864_c0_g1_i1.p1  ORF type:complete len:314 (+),score=73.90 TRINITY_DN34864_c0_g1_i1:32-973(+)